LQSARLAIALLRSVNGVLPARLRIGFGCHPVPVSNGLRAALAWRLLRAIGKPCGIRAHLLPSIGHQGTWWMRWMASLALTPWSLADYFHCRIKKMPYYYNAKPSLTPF
jgi:hypothetical protein